MSATNNKRRTAAKLEDDKMKTKPLFLVIKKVSTSTGTFSSDVQYIFNLPCRIIAKINKVDGKRSLGIFVGLNEDSDDKSCAVKATCEFVVHNKKTPCKPLKKEKPCYFELGSRVHGIDQFMCWEEKVRATNEYITKDEILIQVNVVAFRPTTLSYFTELSTGYYDLFKNGTKPSRDSALFRFKIDNIQKITREYSPTFYVRSMPWRIMATLHEDPTDTENIGLKKLGIFLRCYGVEGTDNWACYAQVSMNIINDARTEPPICRKFTNFYYKDKLDYGFNNLADMEQLADETSGLVDSKGALVIEISVTAEKPFTFPEKKETCEYGNFVFHSMVTHIFGLMDF